MNFFRFWVEGFWISCLLRSRGSLIDPGNKKRKEALTMTGRTERRVREIRRRTRQYRKRHERRVQSASLCRDRYSFAEGTVRRRPHRGGQLWLCAAARRRKRIHCGRHRRLCGRGDSDHDLHPMQKEKNDPHGGCGR